MSKEKEKIPLIRVDGIAPKTKAAAKEAVEAAPQFVEFLIQGSWQHVRPLTDLKPGEQVQFTDGEGRYYGTITRPLDGPGFAVDAKITPAEIAQLKGIQADQKAIINKGGD